MSLGQECLDCKCGAPNCFGHLGTSSASASVTASNSGPSASIGSGGRPSEALIHSTPSGFSHSKDIGPALTVSNLTERRMTGVNTPSKTVTAVCSSSELIAASTDSVTTTLSAGTTEAFLHSTTSTNRGSHLPSNEAGHSDRKTSGSESSGRQLQTASKRHEESWCFRYFPIDQHLPFWFSKSHPLET
ncbi:unnamed protein product [Protopolystoma xenopodis]|uniref:Post-SET domain-containing protein n=1 Tax=Protopolystoma xenopodis TaxID=117903 RepID=A0A448XMU0_9PLAT|nr:unnamed protein product [Protopolystoma xenopodis]